jgi:hypothetical protein
LLLTGPPACRRPDAATAQDATALQLQLSDLKADMASKVDATSLKVRPLVAVNYITLHYITVLFQQRAKRPKPTPERTS